MLFGPFFQSVITRPPLSVAPLPAPSIVRCESSTPRWIGVARYCVPEIRRRTVSLVLRAVRALERASERVWASPCGPTVNRISAPATDINAARQTAAKTDARLFEAITIINVFCADRLLKYRSDGIPSARPEIPGVNGNRLSRDRRKKDRQSWKY